MNLSISEQLLYSTIQIRCNMYGGGESSGTGFFYNFIDGDKVHPAIITNKHVLEGATNIKVKFTKTNDEGIPQDIDHIEYLVEKNIIIFHRSQDIDLCVILIRNILTENANLSYVPLDSKMIPSEEEIKKFKAIEDITMIGYPIGLIDNINNKPIIRKGITATHIKFDYNGKKEFLIDAACFPGSSGSPVFILNEGMFTGSDGNAYVGNRIFLIGVLYAGPQHTVTGNIEAVTIPTRTIPLSVTSIPINLGYVIKAEKIKELEKQVIEEIRKINNR